ncbi:hypothetical protein NUV25_33795 [Burkholderia pseudomultivorans]|uniref:hypothetical protein n=1 Tax=Burkholderia pseudomultivorans TaxID=1207504 RepID=UPI002874CFE8|nr:hypothetical protein [Burkholderia pseudomultivorans]MDS0862681.1 hypothetical protein [Burkholderia pseudomultivorans]
MKRLGIFPRWETEAQLLSQVEADWEQLRENIWEPRRRALEAYANGENPFTDVSGVSPAKYLSLGVSTSLVCAQKEQAEAERLMFSLKDDFGWEAYLAKNWAYEYWRTRIDQYKQVNSTRADYLTSLNRAVETLSTCLCAGWIDQARMLAEEIRTLYERRRFFDAGHYPLYHWLLRICFDHWNVQFDAWGCPDEDTPQALSQPVLNELFEHWRDADLTPMQDHIIWLCDYYTHRTRRKDWYEFSNSHLLTRFPALILAWQRLREVRGLESPRVAHPLMQPTYAQLRPAMPLYKDSVLEVVLERLRREEMPGLGSVRQLALPASHEKRGLIARLFGRT